MTAPAPQCQLSIASIIHELRVSGDPTEEKWADAIEALRIQYADANSDAIRLHHEKMDQYDRAIVAEARIEELERALRKAGELLESRARGYEARRSSIFNGTLMASELRTNARLIAALKQEPKL